MGDKIGMLGRFMRYVATVNLVHYFCIDNGHIVIIYTHWKKMCKVNYGMLL